MYDLGFAGNRSILMKISHFFFVLDSFSIQIKKKKKAEIHFAWQRAQQYYIQFAQN